MEDLRDSRGDIGVVEVFRVVLYLIAVRRLSSFFVSSIGESNATSHFMLFGSEGKCLLDAALLGYSFFVAIDLLRLRLIL